MAEGLNVNLTTDLVSRPYVEMTAAVMRSFGAVVDIADRHVRVESGRYRAVEDFVVEPDASAASYFFALAAASHSTVRVDGLGGESSQGDLRFVEILDQMGAEVEVTSSYVQVRGTGTLRGVDVDMSDCSDTAQTLAAIAPLADGPSRVRGIGFIRAKETDRISAVVTELQRLGVTASATDDGFDIAPGPVRPATILTYDDHRMAMSFAVLGSVVGGVTVADPDCVAKTYPGFWADLAAADLRRIATTTGGHGRACDRHRRTSRVRKVNSRADARSAARFDVPRYGSDVPSGGIRCHSRWRRSRGRRAGGPTRRGDGPADV
jgi:3-phosphoshikimate 1-carboxyvinyltransferase